MARKGTKKKGVTALGGMRRVEKAGAKSAKKAAKMPAKKKK
jgi:hypothetical protein